MINILIADDHPIVRQGLKQIVSVDRNLNVIAEAANGEEVLNVVNREKIDVIILDISMPGKNGLEIIKEVKHDFPFIPILVLSIHPEDQYAVRVLKAGAAGYMNKEAAPDDLAEAIKKAYKGGKYISPKVAELLAGYVESKTTADPHTVLSDREYEVFMMLALGKTVGKIGEELNLSIKTVSTYRTRILEKMRMKTNADMTRYALEYNLIRSGT